MRKLRIIYDVSFMGLHEVCGVHRVVDGTLKALLARPDIELILSISEQINGKSKAQRFSEYIKSDSRLDQCRLVSALPKVLVEICIYYLYIANGLDSTINLLNKMRKDGMVILKPCGFYSMS